MVAGAIAAAGYFVGGDLIGARSANPKGFFEDRGINRINEELLAPFVPRRRSGVLSPLTRHHPRHGQRWLATLPIDTWPVSNDDIDAKIDSYVAQRPFCFKDPRFSYTLPVWHARCDFEPVNICVFRHPGRVVESVARELSEARYLRDIRLSKRRIATMWTRQYEHILDMSSMSGVWIFIHADQIINRSRVPALESVLEAELDKNFADQSLSRATSTRIPTGTVSTYQMLCERADYQPR